MTADRSPHEVQDRHDDVAPSPADTPTTPAIAGIRLPRPLSRRGTVIAAATALSLVGGLAVAAVHTAAPTPDDGALAALGLEVDPTLAPQDVVAVPEGETFALEPTDVDVAIAKPTLPTLREAQAASRAAQRQALEAAEAAAAAERAAVAERAAAEAAAAERAAAPAAPAPERRSEPQASRAAERAPEPQRAASAPSVNAAQGSERAALTSMLNGYRGSNGLPALGRDGTLDAVAQNWAKWMATNQVLQHNPNYRAEIGGGWSAAGENIVRNTGGASMSPDTIVSWMFGWWQNSAPHRKNMLNTRYTHVGVGYYMGSGGPYAVFLFGGR